MGFHSVCKGLMLFQCITPHITECLRWVRGLVFRIEPVLEMCGVQWLTLVLSDGSNQVGVSLPFSPENRQQIQFPRQILFRIPQCTEFTNLVTLNIPLSESFRTEVNITLRSLLRYFHIAGDNIFVFLVKKFSLAYTSTITFIYSVFNFQFNWSQANLTIKFNTSNMSQNNVYSKFFYTQKTSSHSFTILCQLLVTYSSHQ